MSGGGACNRVFSGKHRSWIQVQSATSWTVRMPDCYASKLKIGLEPEEVILKIGDGKEHKVEMYCNGVEVHMRQGWSTFLEEYGINPFDVLVFSYDTPSLLNVAILKVGGDEDPRNQISDEVGPPPAFKYSIPMRRTPVFIPAPGPPYDRGGSGSDTTESYGSDGCASDAHAGMMEVTSPWSVSSDEGLPVTSEDAGEEYVGTAEDYVGSDVDAVGNFTSCQITLGTESVSDLCHLYIPIEFASRCLQPGFNEVDVSFCGRDNWKVSAHMGEGRAMLSYGWDYLVRDTGMAAGNRVRITVDPSNDLVWNVELLH